MAALPPPPEAPLPPSQRRALRLIYESLAARGVPPTYRELMLAMGWRSPNAVAETLGPLQRKGFLAVDGDRFRAMRLVGLRGFALPGLPVFSADAAGCKLMAELFGGRR